MTAGASGQFLQTQGGSANPQWATPLPLSTTVTGAGTIATSGNVFVNNTSGAAITLTLASALVPFVMVKDVAGNANAHPITISFSGGIDGGTTMQLTVPHQWVELT